MIIRSITQETNKTYADHMDIKREAENYHWERKGDGSEAFKSVYLFHQALKSLGHALPSLNV